MLLTVQIICNYLILKKKKNCDVHKLRTLDCLNRSTMLIFFKQNDLLELNGNYYYTHRQKRENRYCGYDMIRRVNVTIFYVRQ